MKIVEIKSSYYIVFYVSVLFLILLQLLFLRFPFPPLGPQVLDPSALFEAVQKGQFAQVETLAAASPSEWTQVFQPRSGDSALMLAARGGHLAIVQFALRSGAHPDQRNFESKTPLMEASQHGRAKVVRCLLAAGANPNALKRGDWTALMLACTKEDVEIVQRLLEDPRTHLRLQNKDGWSAFHLACREGMPEPCSFDEMLDDGGATTPPLAMRTQDISHSLPSSVKCIISYLDTCSSKSSGPNRIPVIVLKNLCRKLPSILSKLFVSCVKISEFLSGWKIASVVSVPEKGCDSV